MTTNPDITVERITERFGLMEGPHWDQRSQKLFFVDIFANKICSLNINTRRVNSAYIKNGPVGIVIPVEGTIDKYIVGSTRDLILVTWNSESNVADLPFQKLASVEENLTDTRLNDGKVDSSGRVWIGTMQIEIREKFLHDKGSFYSIGSDLIPKRHISPVSISNGMDWSLKDDVMYYNDSLTYQIAAFDYNPAKGTITNRRVIFDLKKNNIDGLPDGMTIDTNGNLWVAIYQGSCVLNIDPKQGKLLRTIKIPTKNVTSVAFGGPQLDTLYVTTSSYNVTDSELQEQPRAGCLFAVKGLGVKGRLPNTFKLRA